MSRGALLAALMGVGLFGLGAACLLGSAALAPDRVLAALVGAGGPIETIIVWQVRAPRALAAFITGAALGLCGAALQGLLRNPLAEPGVLGVSACASLGAVATLSFGAAGAAAWALPLAAIAGALLATGVIAAAAARLSGTVTLVLIGVGLSSFAGALMALLMNLAPNPFTLADLVNWSLGSVANRSFADIGFSLPFIVAGAGLILASARGLTLLTLGEEAAQASGLDLRRQRLLVAVGAGLATGGAVALAGAIGFIGIIAAHLVRPLVRHDPGATLVPAALLGGALTLFADIAVRLIPSSTELKLGVAAALIGAPLFVWIAARGRLQHV